jgi:hypothetical protein
MFLIFFFLVLLFIPLLRVYKLIFVEKLISENAFINVNKAPIIDYFLQKEIKVYQFIKKYKIKLPFSIACVCLILIFNISANVSIWHNIKGLTNDDKQTSIAFRGLRGSNCINEFIKLKPVLDAAKDNQYIESDVLNILGKPDMVAENGTVLIYNLFPSSAGCKGVITIASDKVVGCVVENCN